MIRGRVVLGVVISKVVGATFPVEAELLLGFATAEPVEAEPYHFGSTLDNSVVEETSGCGVVGLDWSLRLGPTHFFEGCTKGDEFPGGNVECRKFSFGG